MYVNSKQRRQNEISPSLVPKRECFRICHNNYAEQCNRVVYAFVGGLYRTVECTIRRHCCKDTQKTRKTRNASSIRLLVLSGMSVITPYRAIVCCTVPNAMILCIVSKWSKRKEMGPNGVFPERLEIIRISLPLNLLFTDD